MGDPRRLTAGGPCAWSRRRCDCGSNQTITTSASLDSAASETTMKGSRENRSSHPAGSRAGHTAPKADPPAPENGATRPASISVRCPNPGCGKIYTIRSACAGKTGRCQCGAVFPIPNAGTLPADEPAPQAPGQPRKAVAREEAAPREEEDMTEVRVGCIGRGHAGKTALFRTLGEGPVGDFF